jgi:glycosyltransferase involved in cell wall biosynthesis
MRDGGNVYELPPGVTLVQVTGESDVARLDHWLSICREQAVDVILDHHILYNESWPWFAHAALAAGVPTIGWVHNFALRPIFDRSRRSSFLSTHMRILLRVVTLSPVDVSFWKLRGIERVVYLPNPLSSLALRALSTGSARTHSTGRLELAWWGRLDPSTKQVNHLVEVAEELRRRGVDFRLTIIGPDSRSLTAIDVRQNAIARGVDDAIDLLGEHNAEDLLATLKDAHLLVMTSAIEGSPLTIVEAQALGLPVVMYDLPWLTTVRGNAGVITTAPGDRAALAEAIALIAGDAERYAALSRAALDFARAAASVDVGGLLVALLEDELPVEFSPEPTIEDAELLVDWFVRISERNFGVGGRGKASIDTELASARRERDRALAQLRHVTMGPSFRMGRAITYLPRRLREFARTGGGKPFALPTPTAERPTAPPPPPPLRATHVARPARSTSPDVSIVIPVYNSAPWLDDCISSVLAQTGVDIEVICINDGSTDGSRAILHRFAESDARVTVLDQPNSGQSVGRNLGLEAAVGRYIVFLDSDDYWPKDALATLVGHADDEVLDLLLFDGIAFRDGDVDDETWRWYSRYYPRARSYRQIRSGPDLMAAMRRGRDYRPHVGLYLARTSFVRELGLRFIPGIVHQDNPYTFRLLLNAQRAGHVRLDVYARRIRPGSTITTLSPERSARGYFLAYLEMKRELEGREVPATGSDMLYDIVDSVYDGARKQFALISDATAEQLSALDTRTDAQAAFASLREGNGTHG